MLLALFLIPLLAAALVPLVPKQYVRPFALAGTLVPVGIVLLLLTQHNWLTAVGIEEASRALRIDAAWVPDLGLRFTLDVDGVSMALLALTALLGPICIVGSYSAVTTRIRTYYGWLLVLQAAMTGVFLSRDVILFYVFFEFTLVPMFVLISLFGGANRKAAAIKFFLYTFTGSVLTLAGLVYVAWFNANVLATSTFTGAGSWTFNVNVLAQAAREMSTSQQAWVFVALLCGFAVKVPLFPLHTWLPLAHTEAPTAGSVVLAGVLLKLGTYAIYTFAIPFCPEAAIRFAPVIATLAIIGCVYGGLICWVQTDVKKLVAYSSVAHLGFCMLGMFSFNSAGFQGSILYMINHGLSTGALFLCIGMMYERYHTRNMADFGGLAIKMPIWASFLVFFTMASVGLPGTNGFISEFLCVLGAFQAGSDLAGYPGNTGSPVLGLGALGPYYAFVAGTGMIIAAIYLLYMLGRVCFGPLKEPAGHGHHGSHGATPGHGGNAGTHGTAAHGADHDDHAIVLPADLTGREIGILVPLAVLCVVLGVYPKPLMNMIDTSVRTNTRLITEAKTRMLPSGHPVTPGPDGKAPAAVMAPTDSTAPTAPTQTTMPASSTVSLSTKEGGL